jgi:hypothetical protein
MKSCLDGRRRQKLPLIHLLYGFCLKLGFQISYPSHINNCSVHGLGLLTYKEQYYVRHVRREREITWYTMPAKDKKKLEVVQGMTEPLRILEDIRKTGKKTNTFGSSMTMISVPG